MPRILRLIVAAALLASPAGAGKLDLDLYGAPPPQSAKSKTAYPGKDDLWHPGDMRYLKGENFAVKALATGGYAGMGAAGFVENIGAAGKSKEAAAMSAGFGAIAIINLWRSWKLWREPETKK